MKLIINYDLVNEIRMANTGINLQRIKEKMIIYFGTVSFLDLSVLLTGGDLNHFNIFPGVLYAATMFTTPELILKRLNKELAEQRLSSLSSKLHSINVYTDPDMIKKARLYKTRYELKMNDNKPVIKQNKYIMLPTTGYLNNDEVSILQEHDMFSRDYILSIGEPKKKQNKVLAKKRLFNMG